MCALLTAIVQHHKRWIWVVFWLAFAGWLLFNFVIFPTFTYTFEEVKLKILDVRLWYDAADVEALFSAMDAQGRALYRLQVVFADMVYPAVYGCLLLSALLLSRHHLKKDSYCLRWMIWPFLAVLFDVFENLNTYWMLIKFPDVADVQVFMGAVFTLLKWVSVSVAVGLLLFLVGALVVKRFTQR